jgi:fatty acid desaturase
MMIDVTELGNKVRDDDAHIKERISKLSEPLRIDYYRRMDMARAAFRSGYIAGDMFKKSQKWESELYDANLLKYALGASALLVAIDYVLFGFVGWSLAAIPILVLLAYGFTLIFRVIAEEKKLQVTHWNHESLQSSAMAEAAGISSYDFKDLYNTSELLKDEPEVVTEGDNERRNWVNSYTESDLWNKVKFKVLGVVERAKQ